MGAVGQGLGSYFAVLAIAVVLTLVVGQILLRTGRGYLADVYDDERTASSASTLVVVLFHLVVLGVLALISTVNVPVTGLVQTVVTKVGIILIVLGIAYALTLLALIRIRNRQREEEVQEEMTAQFEAARAEHTGYPAPAPAPGSAPAPGYPGAAPGYPPAPRPAVEGRGPLR